MMIALNEQGFPVDPNHQRLANRLIGRVHSLAAQGRPLSPDFFIRRYYNRRKHVIPQEYKNTATALVKVLVDNGYLALNSNNRLVPVALPPPAFDANGEAASKDARYDAYLTKMAQRVMPRHPDKHPALIRFFRACRRLDHVFTLGVDLCTKISPRSRYAPRFACCIPSDIGINKDCMPVIVRAIVIVITEVGCIHIHEASGAEIVATFDDDLNVMLTVDIGKQNRKELDKNFLGTTSLQPKKNQWSRVVNQISFHALDRNKPDFEAAFKVDMAPTRWKSMMSSLRNKRRNLGQIVTKMIWRNLDKDLLRLTMRNPQATITTYNWFSAQSQEHRLRRKQASDSYPFATCLLNEFTAEIDSGRELVPVLAKRLKITPAVLRRLRGVTWQKMGRSWARLIGNYMLIGPDLRTLPPEKLPTARHEWNGLANVTKVLADAMITPADPDFGNLLKSAAKDWPVFSKKDVGDTLADAVRDISTVICGLLHERINKDQSSRTLFDSKRATIVRKVVLGEGASFVRLLEVGQHWHREINRIRGLIRELVMANGTPMDSWLPLDEDFTSSDGGRLHWLILPSELQAEGQEMGHCVAGYSSMCLFTGSHIAQVFGAKGGRSTVEFRLRKTKDKNGKADWEIQVIQNQAHHNDPAPADCRRVVSEFIKNREAKIDYVKIENARSLRDAASGHSRDTNFYGFDFTNEETCAAVHDLYRPFLNRAAARLTLDQLATLVAKDK
jgi:hypothetical protein